MAYGSLMPAADAPAMWSLEVTTFRGMVAKASHYYVAIEGPDRTVYVMYVITEADLAHLRDNEAAPGQSSERFGSVDDATAGGVVAFGAVAEADDILVPGGPTPEEWPICGPADVLQEAVALREHRLITTWVRTLGRYRQWSSGGARRHQHVVVRRVDDEQRYVVDSVGGVF